jgi:hypothetical protein
MADATSVKSEIDKLPRDELQKLAALLLQSPPDALAAGAKIPIETYRLIYKEYGDQIRHFSTVRSAATTFLLAVSLGALSAYFNKAQTHPFLMIAGFFLLLAAGVVCLVFSFRTEKAVLRYKDCWRFVGGSAPAESQTAIHEPSLSDIVKRMLRDSMNLMLVVAVIVIVAAFTAQDSLSSFWSQSDEKARQTEELPAVKAAE